MGENEVTADVENEINADVIEGAVCNNSNGNKEKSIVSNSDGNSSNKGATKHKRKMNPNSLKNLVPIKPGQVLNPTGRPKTPDEVRQRLKEALPDAVEILIQLAKSAEKDSVRYQAAQDLVDRVLGKPTQPLDIDQTNAVKVEFVGGTDDLAK